MMVVLGAAAQAAPILEFKMGDGLAGSLTMLPGDVYRIMGSGTDVWGNADDCYFVYQTFDSTQPFTMTARVGIAAGAYPAGFDGGTDGWRKAGIMVRQSISDTSIGAEMLIANDDGNGINTQIRKTDGAATDGAAPTGVRVTMDTPIYLKLDYAGDGKTFTTWYKVNAGDPWIKQSIDAFDVLTTPLAGSMVAGLFVTAHNAGQQTSVNFGEVTGFVLAAPDQTLTWDGDTNTWGDLTVHAPDSHWMNGGVLTPEIPTIAGSIGDIAIVPAGTCTVAANQGAYSLDINTTGKVVVGSGNTLTLLTGVTCSVVGGLELQNGKVVTLNGTLVDLVTSGGGGTVDVGFGGTVQADHLIMAPNDTFTKNGGGKITFNQTGGANSLNGTNNIVVNAGEFATKVAGIPNPLNGADLHLEGGTFTVKGTTDFVPVLQAGRFADGTFAQNFSATGGVYTDDGVGIFSGQQLLATTPGLQKLQTGLLSYASTAEFNTYWGTTGDPNEYQAVWTGYYVAQVNGIHQFRIQSGTGGDIDDDGSVWVDGNQSGTFESTEGNTTGTQLTATTVALVAGQRYGVAFGFNENTGGESYRVQFLEPSGTYTAFTTVNPTTQAGYWASLGSGAINMSDTDVEVSATSTLNAITDATALFGSLTFTADATLTTMGALGGIYFTGTTLAPGITNVGFNTLSNTYPGPINDGGVASTITKTGAADLDLVTAPTSLVVGSKFDVQAGGLVSLGTAPLGSASVQLSGGRLSFTSPGGNLNVINPISVTANSALTAGQYLTGVAGPVTVAINNLSPNAGIVSMSTLNSYVLEFPNGLNGAGGVEVVTGEVRTPLATNLGSLILTGGAFTRTGAGATARDISITNELRLVGTDLNMTTGGNALLTAAAGAHINIQPGRTLTLAPTQTPLTIDHLTMQSGTLNPMYIGATQSITATGRYDFTDVTIPWNLANNNAAVYIGYDDRSENPVYLNGTNLYKGETWIRRGTLRADNGVGLPTASRLVFDGNTRDESSMIETHGIFKRNIGTAAGEVYWNNAGGFAAVGPATDPNLVVTLEGGAQLLWNSNTQGFNSVDSVQFGSRNATGMVELTNNIDLAGAADRRFQVEDNRATKADFTRLSGNISGGGPSNQLRFNESSGNNFSWPLVELTGKNTYLNETRIDDATVYAEVSTLTAAKGLPYVSGLCFDGNDDSRPAIFMSHGTMARDIGTGLDALGQGKVRWTSRGGFAARGGDFVVTLNSGATLTWGATGFNGQWLQFGSDYADSVAEITNPINLETTGRNIRVFDNRYTDQDVAKLSGNISSGAIAVGTAALTRDDADSYLGTLWLSGTNTYTGITRITDGFLRAQDGIGLPTTSNLQMTRADTGRPDIFESWGTFTRQIGVGAGQVTFAANGTGNSGGGFAAWSAPLTVTLLRGDGNAALPLDWDSATNGFNGSALCGGSQTANNVADMTNDIMLGTTDRTWRLFDNPYSDKDVTKFSGVISNQGAAGGTGRAVLLDNFPWSTDYYGGSATVWFTGANIYTGITRIDDAILRAQLGVGLSNVTRLVLDADSASRPAIFESYGTITNWRIGTAAGQVAWGNNGGGFAAWSDKLTITLQRGDQAATPLDWNHATNGFNTTTLMLGSTTANNEVELTNNINLNGGTRAIRLFDNLYSSTDQARLSGVLANGTATSALSISGAGRLILSANNTYTGNTEIYGGPVLVTGSINTLGGRAMVHSGGILGGTGTVGAMTVEAGGVLSPGMSPGAIYAGDGVVGNAPEDVYMMMGAIYEWQLDKNAQDLVYVLGDLKFDSNWKLRLLLNNMLPDPTERYPLFYYTGTVKQDGTTVGDIMLNCDIDGSMIDRSQYAPLDLTGVHVWNDTQEKMVYLFGLEAMGAGAIPEPTTLTLLGLGALALLRRRRQRKA